MHNPAALPELPHVLVVDDDDRISGLLARFLADHEIVALTAASAAEARDLLKAFQFDLLILDIMMPGETGLSFLEDFRRTERLPVILLTALGEADDRIKGLESGADDYLPKPFDPRELLLRVKAILRRNGQQATSRTDPTRKVGKWRFDPKKAELLDGDVIIKLTPVESNLLQVLTAQPGVILSREDLARLCQLEGQERAIDVQVTRLRRKLEENPALPRILQTIRGKGYILYDDAV